MNRKTIKIASAAVTAAALALPATAAAHPSVYSAIAKVAKTPAQQTITVTNATGGTFKPSAAASPVAYDAPAAQVEAALQSDPAIGYLGVAVTGPAGGPYAITFTGPQAGVAKTALVPDDSALTGVGAEASASVGQAGGANVTPTGDPAADQAAMSDQPQFVITNDGYTVAYRETNGIGPDRGPGIVSGEGRGMLNLSKVLPSAYRTGLSALAKLAYAPAWTGVQPHATCTGVAALRDPNTIWAWQQRADNDPFFDYIPWQKASAGLGDEPEKWIPTVKTATGVDLATRDTVQQFTDACTGLGGTYRPADTASVVTSAVVADAVDAATAPLNDKIGVFTTQVGDLTTQLASLTGEKSALASANAKLTADNAALVAAAKTSIVTPPAPRPLRVTLAASKVSLSVPAAAMATGPAGRAVTVRLTTSASIVKALGLKSATLAKATAKLDDQGAALLTLKLSKATTKALKKVKGTIPAKATVA
ncbi:hypothetical protein [Baekduia sp. Peel2402]|uniref:hypothetical protein n=1 Tax=Baekduia sp. Peel2402 TaxID=3458296 RepID=UPI00403E60BD